VTARELAVRVAAARAAAIEKNFWKTQDGIGRS
jgi:hypothetical protein